MNSQLKWYRKAAYGSGDLGINLVLQATSLFYLFFLTDVFGLPPGAAGFIILVGKLWDAVTDPLMGSLVDKTRSPWGSKKPWILAGILPLAAGMALLFTRPDLPPDLRYWYALGTYLLFNTALTVVNIPYASLTVSLTHDPDQRSVLTAWRMAFALLGTLLAGAAVLPLVEALGGGIQGWSLMGLAAGLTALVLNLLPLFSGKELPVPLQDRPGGYRQGLKAALQNRPFLVLSLGTLLSVSGVLMMSSAVNYYFRYLLQDPGGVTPALALLLTVGALCLPLVHILSHKWGKKWGFMIPLAVLALVALALGQAWRMGTAPVLGLFALAGIGMSAVYLSPWSMVADTIEYSQWKSGIRPEGILYGLFLFVMKTAAALAAAVSGLVLELGGYVANTDQSDSALAAIASLVSWVPALFVGLGILTLSFYGLSQELHKRILKELRDPDQ